jgi:antitoxin (DNA-binding transcriptional repressor) of toxin-antitoxin stability system
LIVTEHGRAIATIDPVETPNRIEWARAMVAAGRAQWEGGKPQGCRAPVAATGGRTVSAAVIEDRR